MRKVFSIIIVITSAVMSISAQTKLERRHHSEAISRAAKTDTRVSEVGNGAFYPRTSYNYPLEDFKPGVVRVGPRTTYLKTDSGSTTLSVCWENLFQLPSEPSRT